LSKRFFNVFLILFFVCNISILYSQVNPSDYDDDEIDYDFGMKQNKADTLRMKYSFSKGDELVYRIVAFDSISIDYDIPLKKSRYERLLIKCDSVTPRNTFILSHRLIDYIGFESKGDIEGIKRTGSPWINRVVQIEIDSVGRRLNEIADDTLRAAMSPGGAFNPVLFFPFEFSERLQNQSWNISGMMKMQENGVPYPLLRYSALFKSNRKLDTLDHKCVDLEFIRTGQGSVGIVTEDTKIKATNVINSAGNIYISEELNIPIFYRMTQEQKLTLHFPNDIHKPGWHYTNISYTLDSYNPAPKIENNVPKNVRKNP